MPLIKGVSVALNVKYARSLMRNSDRQKVQLSKIWSLTSSIIQTHCSHFEWDRRKIPLIAPSGALLSLSFGITVLQYLLWGRKKETVSVSQRNIICAPQLRNHVGSGHECSSKFGERGLVFVAPYLFLIGQPGRRPAWETAGRQGCSLSSWSL